MEILILLVLSGILAAVFASQNPINVPIILLGYSIREVPVYIIAAGSLLIGLLLSFLLSLITSISTSFRLHGKDVKIKESKKTVSELIKQNREFELEIARLQERVKVQSKSL